MRIRAAAGMSARSLEAARRGLPNSLYAVHIVCAGAVVGMGRVVGDGGLNFEIVDIAVVPEHQGRGLGRRIMEAIMAYLEANAPDRAYISMIADQPGFYVRYGFKEVSPSQGMYIRKGEA